jgi:hypothetical protein
MAMAQARELVHNSKMGTTYGIMETLGAAIIILAPPLAGTLYERDSMIVYPIAIALMAISIVASYLFLPQRARVPILGAYRIPWLSPHQNSWIKLVRSIPAASTASSASTIAAWLSTGQLS